MLQKMFEFLKVKPSPIHAFFLGVFAALLGIATAFFVFPKNVGLISVFFTSIALMPFINKLLGVLELRAGREEIVQEKGISLTEFKMHGKKFRLGDIWFEQKNLIKVYAFSFLGVFIVYALLTLIYPTDITVQLFGEQTISITGSAAGVNSCGMIGFVEKENVLIEILENNLWVLIICFLVSLIYGAGSTLIITWNASVWGIAFASYAQICSSVLGQNPYTYFGLILLVVLPHTIAEIASYFIAAISGGIASKGFIKEKIFGERFNQIVGHALLLLFIAIILWAAAAVLEVYAIDFFSWLFLV